MPHTRARLKGISHASAAVRKEIDDEIDRRLAELAGQSEGPPAQNTAPNDGIQQGSAG